MLNPDIEKIFDRIPVGALVRVQGPILGREHWKLKRLVRGDRGSLIMLVQNRLRAAGYYRRECDGIFGRDLEQAVKKYQREHRLEVSGQIRMAPESGIGGVMVSRVSTDPNPERQRTYNPPGTKKRRNQTDSGVSLS